MNHLLTRPQTWLQKIRKNEAEVERQREWHMVVRLLGIHWNESQCDLFNVCRNKKNTEFQMSEGLSDMSEHRPRLQREE